MRYTTMKQKTVTSDESGSFVFSNAIRRNKSGKWRLAALALFALMPALNVQGAVDDVGVDQSPLIVSDPLPPNIVLLHDDSGSMERNYLPDTAPKSGNKFRNSSLNRQYYNPQTIYPIPPKADGSLYPEPKFPYGYKNPFTSNKKDDILSQSKYSDSLIYVNPTYTSYYKCSDAGGK